VFELARNAGITAFDVRPVPGDARRFEAYLEVLNASQGSERVEVKVMGAGAPALTRTLELAGGAIGKAVFDVSRFDTGPLRATVRIDADALELDDSAYSFMPSKRTARLVVVTRGNAFLERSLRVLPRAQVTLVAPERFHAATGYDAAVFDRWAPPAKPAVPSLLIRPGSARWLPARAGDLGETPLESWDRTHPLLRNVSLQDVTVERALLLRPEVTPAEGGVIATLAAGPRGQPLILASQAGSRWLELAFALEESNFPLQQAFPVFLANALAWMMGETLALDRTLGAVEIPAVGMRIVDLDGREIKTQQMPHATLFDAPRPALYTATSADQRMRIAVNLADARVTAINATPFATAATAAPEVQAFARLAAEPWVLLLTLAAALLGLEWVTYNRRATV
jgi:hypothetical protein